MTELPAPALSAGEITTHALEIKAGGAPGSFEGYGAVFGNRDSDGDIIQPGAFRASLKARKPVLLWQHDKREPIGVFDVVREDEKGLYVAGRLSAEGKGREAYELLKMGALNGLSIGFVTREANRDSIQGARLITKADLMEVSLVTFPANDLARVSHVKSSSLIEDPRSFEAFLRESGFSRTRAKAITAKGFKGADLTAGESAEIAALVYGLKRRQQVFEGKGIGGKSLRFAVPPMGWSVWQVLASVTMSRPGYFNISAKTLNFGGAKHPFQLEVSYGAGGRTQTFLWQSNGNPSRGKRYLLPEGMNEIRVRGRSLGAFHQDVYVSLVSV